MIYTDMILFTDNMHIYDVDIYIYIYIMYMYVHIYIYSMHVCDVM